MTTKDVEIVPTKLSHFEGVSGPNVVETENYILCVQSGKGEPMSIINDILKWCTWSKTYSNMWKNIICEMLIEWERRK